MRIRSYLLVFVLAVLLPMLAFSTIAVIAFGREQRATAERGGVETARALMGAVDGELRRSLPTLQALATSRSLERDDLGAFHEEARRVLASQRDWVGLLLIAPSGQLVVDTAFPYGTSLPPLRERA